jgi:hypothetical protein
MMLADYNIIKYVLYSKVIMVPYFVHLLALTVTKMKYQYIYMFY